MKFGQLISVVIIAVLVGVASNIGYTYLSIERPNADEVEFETYEFGEVPELDQHGNQLREEFKI